nr:DNA gyrase [bacterium]
MITFENRAEAHETVDKQLRYMQIIEILDGKEMTAKEIAVEMKKKGYIPTDERNFAAPRLTELSIKGIVEPTSKKRCEYTGKTVSVYKMR